MTNTRALRSFLAAALAWAALSLPALAQTTPNWTYRYVPTTAEWNALFASKQDYLGAPPLLTTGGTMVGRLVTAAPGATTASFNLPPGSDPASPANGDMWSTATAMKARINGVTVSLGASSGTVQSVALAMPAIFSVSGSPVTVTGTLTATLATQTANIVFAGPSSGGAVAPTFRSLVTLDMPASMLVASTGLTGGTLAYGGTIAIDKATGANYFAGTSNKVLTADIVYQAEVATTFGSTTTFDFNNFINASVTLTGNITTQTLSNVTIGKAGSIRFIQDGTGSRTTVWNTIFKFPGGTTPTLTTTINASDVLNYNCVSATFCQASLSKDVK
jgi:hypothetical protein